VPFGDLGFFVFCDHPLNLGEQDGLWVVRGEIGCIAEMHGDTEPA
jgi:hypothetical protein